jgi:hypothetical protein
LATIAYADALSFAAVPFAADDAAKRAVTSAASAKMDGVEVSLAFHTILRTGDKLGDQVFGALTGRDGKAIGQPSANPDFTSMLPVGSKLFSLSHLKNNQQRCI